MSMSPPRSGLPCPTLCSTSFPPPSCPWHSLTSITGLWLCCPHHTASFERNSCANKMAANGRETAIVRKEVRAGKRGQWRSFSGTSPMFKLSLCFSPALVEEKTRSQSASYRGPRLSPVAPDLRQGQMLGKANLHTGPHSSKGMQLYLKRNQVSSALAGPQAGFPEEAQCKITMAMKTKMPPFAKGFYVTSHTREETFCFLGQNVCITDEEISSDNL